MKKLIIIIVSLLIIVLIGIIFITNNTRRYRNENTFDAEIMEKKNANTLLVKVIKNNDVFKKDDIVVVHLLNSETNSINYTKEMQLQIIFDGNIEETYPPQITASNIKLIVNN